MSSKKATNPSNSQGSMVEGDTSSSKGGTVLGGTALTGGVPKVGDADDVRPGGSDPSNSAKSGQGYAVATEGGNPTRSSGAKMSDPSSRSKSAKSGQGHAVDADGGQQGGSKGSESVSGDGISNLQIGGPQTMPMSDGKQGGNGNDDSTNKLQIGGPQTMPKTGGGSTGKDSDEAQGKGYMIETTKDGKPKL